MTPGRKATKRRKSAKPSRAGRRAGRAPRAPASGPPAEAPPAGGDRKTRLGRKWACFGCGLKFYDLNRPEPLCPKCGADQRVRPREPEAVPLPAPERRPPPRSLLLDDDEEARDASLSADDLEGELAGFDDEDLGEEQELPDEVEEAEEEGEED